MWESARRHAQILLSESRLTTTPSIQQDHCSGNGTPGHLIESAEAVKPPAQIGRNLGLFYRLKSPSQGVQESAENFDLTGSIVLHNGAYGGSDPV